jgi:hypothetical protein
MFYFILISSSFQIKECFIGVLITVYVTEDKSFNSDINQKVNFFSNNRIVISFVFF